MKECLSCHIFYLESTMVCQKCDGLLKEITLQQALEHTRKKFLNHFTQDYTVRTIDGVASYAIASYFKNHSLFLSFDLNKNVMKYGLKKPRFLIQPMNITCVFNIPWAFFNVIYSNYFHIVYNGFCAHCHCKHILGRHPKADCEYNVGYFSILRDVLNGSILRTKDVYKKFYEEDRRRGRRNPYADLLFRLPGVEAFFDLLSICFSIFLWMYVAVYVSFPMVKVLLQKLEFYDAYEWHLF